MVGACRHVVGACHHVVGACHHVVGACRHVYISPGMSPHMSIHMSTHMPMHMSTRMSVHTTRFSSGYILDLDIDFLVADDEAPKMSNLFLKDRHTDPIKVPPARLCV